MNDEFAGVRSRPVVDEFAGVRSRPVLDEITGDSWPALIGKSALKGITNLADIPKGLLSLGEASINLNRQYNPISQYFRGDEEFKPTNYSDYIPDTNDVRRYLKEKTNIDLEPRPQGSAQNIAKHAIEFGAGGGGFGAIGKSANLLSKFKRAGTVAAEGVGIGGISGALQEEGVDPLVGDALGIAAMNPRAVGGAARNVANVPNKIARGVMGLNPKNLKLKAALSGRELGIDLPAAALTDSTLTGLADQWVQKAPFFGNRLKHKYNQTEEQTRKALDTILDEIGPSLTPEVEAQITKLYTDRAAKLPEGAVIQPNHTSNALSKIETDTMLPSADEISLFNQIETLKSELKPGENATIKRLIGTKKSLNDRVNWDKGVGVKNQLKTIQRAVNDDIGVYGKLNPEWYNEYKEADRLFGSTKRRAKIEELLYTKGTNPQVGDINYGNISKNINTDKQKEWFKKQLGADSKTFKKIEHLGEVARAMAIKNKNIPNPSGTAATIATMGVVSSLVFNPAAVLTGSGAGAILGAEVSSRLLTNKKFLDSAISFAEKPSLIKSFKVNKQIENITGYSVLTLNRMISELDE